MSAPKNVRPCWSFRMSDNICHKKLGFFFWWVEVNKRGNLVMADNIKYFVCSKKCKILMELQYV